jgi:hypothetical protein
MTPAALILASRSFGSPAATEGADEAPLDGAAADGAAAEGGAADGAAADGADEAPPDEQADRTTATMDPATIAWTSDFDARM